MTTDDRRPTTSRRRRERSARIAADGVGDDRHQGLWSLERDVVPGPFDLDEPPVAERRSETLGSGRDAVVPSSDDGHGNVQICEELGAIRAVVEGADAVDEVLDVEPSGDG